MNIHFQSDLCGEPVADVPLDSVHSIPLVHGGARGLADDEQPYRPLSVYAVLLSSVGRQRLCTPLRSLLVGGGGR